jgi:hypothetical protein
MGTIRLSTGLGACGEKKNHREKKSNHREASFIQISAEYKFLIIPGFP